MSLLFVAAEHCSSVDLLANLQLLSDQGKLARIVVDEVHLAITWSDFRSSMYDVHRLRMQKNSPVPLLLLSATVPIAMEEQLKVCFSSNFVTFRSDSTIRPNLKYSVVQCKDANCMAMAITNRIVDKNLYQFCGVIYV